MNMANRVCLDVSSAVEGLVVSVGDSKVVHLSDDQLTLSAYVLPLDEKND